MVKLDDMKKIILVPLLLGIMQLVFAQEAQLPKFYLGISYGTSYAIGDFEDTDITNPATVIALRKAMATARAAAD